VVNPFFGTNQGKETDTVTPTEIIYQRRVHVIERAPVVGVARACREAGVSRTSYYRWCKRAERYGLSALMPKARRRPQVRTETPAHEEEIILAEAISRPTLGARRLLEQKSAGSTAPAPACRRSFAVTTWRPDGSGWRRSLP